MKPFYKTSEFWGTVLCGLGGILAAATGLVAAPVAAVMPAGSTAAYAISRGIVKHGNDGQ